MYIADTPFITIIGAGLAGALLALRLARMGHRVELYERFPDPSDADVPSGRSINLALAERGRHALREAGLLKAVDKITVPMAGRMIHRLSGESDFQAYGQQAEEVIYSVHRDQLCSLLLDRARQQAGIRLHFHRRLETVNFKTKTATYIDDRDGRQYTHDYHVILGADGAGSALRHAMEAHDGVETQADLLDHAYREFTIPPAPNGDFALKANALHIWPRGGFMLIALPNHDRSFTATLFLARESDRKRPQEPAFDQIEENVTAWRTFLGQHFAQALPLLTQLETDLHHHPVSHLGTIRCPRWHCADNAIILGDAAHAVVPFHGQGMNAAFEDVDQLIALLDKVDDWPTLMQRFHAQRKPNTDALATMALENYTEMREGVRDPHHLQRKQLEWALERHFPERFIPRYSMVMFHRLPYATALQRGHLQAKIIESLLEIKGEHERIHHAEQLIHQRLSAIRGSAGGVSLIG